MVQVGQAKLEIGHHERQQLLFAFASDEIPPEAAAHTEPHSLLDLLDRITNQAKSWTAAKLSCKRRIKLFDSIILRNI